MAVECFLKFEGPEIKGEAKGLADQIDVLAWSWGASQSGHDARRNRRRRRQGQRPGSSITKWIDKASPNLLQFGQQRPAFRQGDADLPQGGRRRAGRLPQDRDGKGDHHLGHYRRLRRLGPVHRECVPQFRQVQKNLHAPEGRRYGRYRGRPGRLEHPREQDDLGVTVRARALMQPFYGRGGEHAGPG